MLPDAVTTVFARARALWNLPTQLIAMEYRMTSREETAYSNLMARIDTVKTGWVSLKTENEQLRAALQEADAAKVQAVDEALAADSDHDAAAIEAADASLAELADQPTEEQPPTEETPVDLGDGEPTTGA